MDDGAHGLCDDEHDESGTGHGNCCRFDGGDAGFRNRDRVEHGGVDGNRWGGSGPCNHEHGAEQLALGADLPYVITVTNNGPQDATGVVMTDPVPGNLQPLMVVASETCTHIVNIDTGATTLSCAIGALANGASTQISYHVTPMAAGSLTNTATVAGSSTDPNMGNNSASVTTTVGGAAATHFSVTGPEQRRRELHSTLR